MVGTQELQNWDYKLKDKHWLGITMGLTTKKKRLATEQQE